MTIGDFGVSDPWLQGAVIDASLGHVPKWRTENKFGGTDNLDAALTDIWDGSSAEGIAAGGSLIWLAPTAARIHAIVSSSLTDSDVGGANPQSTGARTVEVTGLETWDSVAPTTEIVILDGTTAVNTVNSYVIIYRLEVLTWGSGGLNVGTITATAATDTTITAMVLIGKNQTQMAIYGISSTMRMRVNRFFSYLVKTAGVTLRATGEVLWMTDPATNAVAGTAWTNRENFELTTDVRWDHKYVPPKKFDGSGIVKLQMFGSANNVNVTAGFDAIIKDD